MTDFDEIIRQNLENDWGAAAPYSDYKPGDILRYRRPHGETASGVIVWVAAPGPSAIEGHDDLPLRYIVERHGWTGFPDVVWQADVLSAEAEAEPTLEKCPYCQAYHSKGQVQYCPLNPHKPSL